MGGRQVADGRRLKDIVYSNGHVKGKVFCLRVSADGDIEVLDEATSGGKGPTHLAVNQDYSALLIAHASVFRRRKGSGSLTAVRTRCKRPALDGPARPRDGTVLARPCSAISILPPHLHQVRPPSPRCASCTPRHDTWHGCHHM